MTGSAAVEAEDELVEVGLQVFVAQAMVDAERPGLEVGEDAVHPGQDKVGGHRADDMGLVVLGRHSGVGRPAVRPGGCAGYDIGVDEAVETRGGEIVDAGETDTARPPAFDLDGTGDQQLTLVAAPVTTGNRVFLGPMIDCGFIDFHQAGQSVAFGIGHGAAELGREQPGCLVGAEAELPPKLKGRDAIGMGGHQIGGPEPDAERQLAAMHEGPGPERGLAAAMTAFVGPSLGRQPPGPVVAECKVEEAEAAVHWASSDAFPARPADASLEDRLWSSRHPSN